MPTLNIKSTQQAIKVGEHKGEEMRQAMRQAMRYAGPRMMWYHPIVAIRHLIRELPEQREQSEARFNYAESRQKKAEGQHEEKPAFTIPKF